MHLAGLPVGDTLQSKEHHYSQMQAASFILGVALQHEKQHEAV